MERRGVPPHLKTEALPHRGGIGRTCAVSER